MISDVYLFNNGMVLTFDEKGEQICAYQGPLGTVRDKILTDAPANAKFSFASWRPTEKVTISRKFFACLVFESDKFSDLCKQREESEDLQGS